MNPLVSYRKPSKHSQRRQTLKPQLHHVSTQPKHLCPKEVQSRLEHFDDNNIQQLNHLYKTLQSTYIISMMNTRERMVVDGSDVRGKSHSFITTWKESVCGSELCCTLHISMRCVLQVQKCKLYWRGSTTEM